jgi:hypothetical protein
VSEGILDFALFEATCRLKLGGGWLCHLLCLTLDMVPAHRSLAMSHSLVVLGCRAWKALPHGMKILPARIDVFSL